jgi:hypothetical protein
MTAAWMRAFSELRIRLRAIIASVLLVGLGARQSPVFPKSSVSSCSGVLLAVPATLLVATWSLPSPGGSPDGFDRPRSSGRSER